MSASPRPPADNGSTIAAALSGSEMLDVIFDAVPAFIWVKDRNNCVLRVNRLAAEAVGVPRDAIEGRQTQDVYPDEAEQYFEADREVIETGQAKLGIIEPLASASGEKRWVRTDKIPYRDASGAIVGVIVFAVDITERIRTERALQVARDGLEQRVAERTAALVDAVADLRAEVAERRRVEERLREQQIQLVHLQRMRTVESLAAQLAHEINQPLAAIVNFADGLVLRVRGGRVDTDGLLEASKAISQQALRAAEVVRRLREFVRRGDSSRQQCLLAPLLHNAVEMVQADARRRGVTIGIEAAPADPLVEVDQTQIEQVVVNLLINALEACAHAPRPPAISVALLRREDGAAEIRVRDSGPGVEASDLQRVFEAFYTTKPDGLGLGLPISKSIVVAHGGTLWAEAAPEGGAAFVFTLPGVA